MPFECKITANLRNAERSLKKMVRKEDRTFPRITFPAASPTLVRTMNFIMLHLTHKLCFLTVTCYMNLFLLFN